MRDVFLNKMPAVVSDRSLCFCWLLGMVLYHASRAWTFFEYVLFGSV